MARQQMTISRIHTHLETIEQLKAEIERLRAALEPFQRNVEAISLSATLGHIGREDLWRARKAFKNEQKADDFQEPSVSKNPDEIYR